MSLTTGSTTNASNAPPSRQALYAAKTKAAEAAKAAAERKAAESASTLQTMADSVSDALGTTVSFSEDAFTSLKNGAATVAGGIGSGMNSAYQAVKSGVSSAMSSQLAQDVIAVPEAVVSNVSDAAENVLSEAASVASDAASVATFGAVGAAKLLALFV